MMNLASLMPNSTMALVTITEAARLLGYASRSQLKRLRDEGRIDDFRHKVGDRERIEMKGLHEHIASIVMQRSNGNICQPKGMDNDWQKIADVVNGWLEPKYWDDTHPFTPQQLATLYTCIQDAAEELHSV